MVTAIILAGGQATRMQGEKPLRMLRGRTLLHHAVELVRSIADEILISTGNRELPSPAGLRSVPDAPAYAGKGPLAGVLAGLEAARYDVALLLACDLPNLPPALLKKLIESLGKLDCVWTEHAGHPEPLVAALKVTPARKAVQKALSAGALRVVPCWLSMAHQVLGEPELSEFAPLERIFANLNTLEDLEREARP